MYFTINFDLFSGGLNSLCTSLLRSCTRILHCVLFFDENEVRMLFSYHTLKNGVDFLENGRFTGPEKWTKFVLSLVSFSLIVLRRRYFYFCHAQFIRWHAPKPGNNGIGNWGNLCFGFGTGIKDTALRPVLLIRR